MLPRAIEATLRFPFFKTVYFIYPKRMKVMPRAEAQPKEGLNMMVVCKKSWFISQLLGSGVCKVKFVQMRHHAEKRCF